MTFEELKAEWETDHSLSLDRCDTALANLPYLLGKWHFYYRGEKKALKKIQQDLLKIRKTLRYYYKGQLTDSALEKLDRLQFQRVLKTKDEFDEHIMSDDMFIQCDDALAEQETKVQFIVDCIRYVSTKKGQDLRTALEFLKYTHTVPGNDD